MGPSCIRAFPSFTELGLVKSLGDHHGIAEGRDVKFERLRLRSH